MKNSNESASPVDALDLEFPDWSGMDRFTPRLSAATALRLNEDYVRRFALRPSADEAPRRPACEVEFVL